MKELIKNLKVAPTSRRGINCLAELRLGLPETSGVYKMINKEGTVIYVGKAKNLRHRVQQYFQKDYSHSTRTRKMLEHTAGIEYIETDSELEALLLENNIIKELRPRYNILMKDDKSYVYIKVNLDEDFPRIRIVREREIQRPQQIAHKAARQNCAKYFGPKLATMKVYETLRILKKLFPFRHCNLDIKWREQDTGNRKNVAENLQLSPNKKLVDVTNRVIDFPCLDYFIKRCPGPCIGAINPIEYKKIVQQIMDFLEGKSDELEKSLKAQMAKAAEQKLFEKAARLRDKLFALQSIIERQKITDYERKDTDVINFTTEFERTYFNIFMIRSGKLISCENFVLDAFQMKETEIPMDAKEMLSSFIQQYYERAAYIPKEILIPEELENRETLEKWLNAKILNPKRGEKNKLLELSHKNAVSFAKQYRVKWLAEQKGQTALNRLAEVLKNVIVKHSLKRIEGFDISHLGGADTVGSMVVFENGSPKSSDYRHFKIRTVSGKPDDYRCMEEILMRRLKIIAHGAKQFIYRKPAKKIFEKIKKIIEDEPQKLEPAAYNQSDFLCIFKKTDLVGFCRLIGTSETSGEIKSLWIDPTHRKHKYGYELMKRIIEKSKLKKFYVYVKSQLENYYAEFGFQKAKEVPESMKERIATTVRACREEGVLMVIEKKRLSYHDKSLKTKPDLIIIDGGKGQLSTAQLVLKRLKLEIPIVALAKRLEEIYLPAEKAPMLLEEGDEALKLLQRIRDESHRFAITFQRELHRKTLLSGDPYPI